jgi:hypothetical protein
VPARLAVLLGVDLVGAALHCGNHAVALLAFGHAAHFWAQQLQKLARGGDLIVFDQFVHVNCGRRNCGAGGGNFLGVAHVAHRAVCGAMSSYSSSSE